MGFLSNMMIPIDRGEGGTVCLRKANRTCHGKPIVWLGPRLGYNGIMEVDLHEARAHFSRLLKRVALGEQVVITKAGTAVAKLVPINPKKRKFRLGSARGEFVVPEDFNEPDPELEDLFYQPLPE